MTVFIQYSQTMYITSQCSGRYYLISDVVENIHFRMKLTISKLNFTLITYHFNAIYNCITNESNCLALIKERSKQVDWKSVECVFEDVGNKSVRLHPLHCDVEYFDCSGWKLRTIYFIFRSLKLILAGYY